jgi:RNA polymerase sigma factor (sigma-70 family)
MREREPTFDAWFVSAYPRTVGILGRLVGDRESAEDLAAEALSRALVRWHKLEGADFRDAWLTRVAVNLGIDQLRRKPPPVPPPSVEMDGANDLVELQLALRQALSGLPRRQREALALRYLVGLSPDEVASTLDVSLGTVKTHLRRGLQSLRSSPHLITEDRLDVLATD